jgi:hypothetical protein
MTFLLVIAELPETFGCQLRFLSSVLPGQNNHVEKSAALFYTVTCRL